MRGGGKGELHIVGRQCTREGFLQSSSFGVEERTGLCVACGTSFSRDWMEGREGWQRNRTYRVA